MRHFLAFALIACLLVGGAFTTRAQAPYYITNITQVESRGDFCNQFDTAFRKYPKTRFPLYTSERTKGPSTADTFKFETISAVRSAVFTTYVDRLAGRSDSVTVTYYGIVLAPGSRTPSWRQLQTTTLSNTAASVVEYAVTGTAGLYYQRYYVVLSVGNTIPTASIKWQGTVYPQ